MRIEHAELLLVRLELRRPFVTSDNHPTTHTEHILVRLVAEGLVGWGECACFPTPYYSEETTETCWHILRDFLLPAVLGRTWERIEDVVALSGRVRRNHFARAGLQLACWDLLAQAQQQPLWRLLGGTRSTIAAGVSLGIEQETAALCAEIDRALAAGYQRVKLKIAPGNDLELLQTIRQRYPTLPLLVDANGAYTRADLPTLQHLDRYGLLMIEQPLPPDDLTGHAWLQQKVQTPICLDESLTSPGAVQTALALGSCRIVNIKPGRFGGLLEAVQVHDLCVAQGIPVWCGGMHEYGIGRAANVALASLPGFTLPSDVAGSDKSYAVDIVEPPIRAVQGSIALPQTPGLGWAPDEARIRQHTVRVYALSWSGASPGHP